jgi:hypothetical protein
MNMKRLHLLVIFLTVSGCAAIGATQFEKLYGEAEPRDRIVDTLPSNSIDYWDDVQPIVENRCIVCHGCYDAPCQLKMSAIEGIVRGANPDRVYNSVRVKKGQMTRLFEDAQTVGEWREKGFHPVLNEYPSSPAANRDASVMHKILQLKQTNPLPDVQQLPKEFTLTLDRKQVCTTAEEFDKYAAKNPMWGMPYALPGLASDEQDVLERWIEQGATYTPRKPLPQAFKPETDRWEAFLNDPSLKQQLASRYIYEHLSYAHLYFPDVDELQFFTIVRSATPPGVPIELIATRRPFDDPGVERVYYRLQEYVSAIVEKMHMPYALNEQRMQFWQELFIAADYTVTELPSYAEAIASNPFVTFAAMPINSRYRFMLNEAQFTIMAFIKGPVCRGEVAVNVIDDHFWVFFMNPDRPGDLQLERFLAEQGEALELPASTDNIYRVVHRWNIYKKQQKAFLEAKDQYLSDLGRSQKFTRNALWYGNDVNPNAALTVFRNFDNAEVKKGLLGQPPKTSWVIGYSLLERIHYLLVAGYDVYGNLGHQLDTRLYMDFLRMEGESNFLMFLPEAARISERDYWYRDVDDDVKAYVVSPTLEKGIVPDIDYKTDRPKLELYAMLQQRLAPVLPTVHDLSSVSNPQLRDQLARLETFSGSPATLLAEETILQVNTASGPEYFSLLSNTAYANVARVFGAEKYRRPDEDTLTIVPGIIGSYPNAYAVVDEQNVEAFVDSISKLATESDYAALWDTYGVRRTNPKFWPHSDTVHSAYRQADPIEFGMLDYSRLENR